MILQWTSKQTGDWEHIRFDVVTTESHEAVMSITSHPVEEGSDIADNARPEPLRITIEGFVSNKPLLSNPDVASLMRFQSTDLNIPALPPPAGPWKTSVPQYVPRRLSIETALALVGGSQDVNIAQRAASAAPPKSATVLKANGDFPDRARAVLHALRAAQLDRNFIRLISKICDVYPMLIERVAVPRTVDDGNGLTIQVDLLRVRMVSSQTVAAPLPAEARGAKQVSQGSKAAEESDNVAKVEAESILSGLFSGGQGLVAKVL